MTGLRPVYAVVEREVLKLMRQRSRLLSAMVRPMIWLFVIGAGFDAMVGEIEGVSYQHFLVPGVLGMSMLFGAMLAALATVYDKESGVMRMLVIAPFQHYWIVLAKMLGASIAAIIQALLLLALLGVLGFIQEISIPLLVLALVTTSLACAGVGMLIAAWTPTLENYAVIMNLVIFPMFFLSGALYPVQHLPDVLRWIAGINPYTYGVDLLKHATLLEAPAGLGADFAVRTDIAVLVGFTVVATLVACWRFSRDQAYEPLVHKLAKARVD
jgi:ABC-2 type transport system permease protein